MNEIYVTIASACTLVCYAYFTLACFLEITQDFKMCHLGFPLQRSVSLQGAIPFLITNDLCINYKLQMKKSSKALHHYR